MIENDFYSALRVLHESGVEFIIVGGLSAVLNGAPINTFDLDVIHSRDSQNVRRLLGALDVLDAIYRIQPSRRLRPTASHLESAGHQNLVTRYGPLDFRGVIGKGLTYADLLLHSAEKEIGEGLRVRVLDLETLIAIKEELGGEKDLAVLPILRRTLEERKKLGYTPQQ